jgi:hypothetical protein
MVVVFLLVLCDAWGYRVGDCVLLLREQIVKDSFWMWEEIFIGACLQFPLYFIVGWWVLPLMVASGILWRLGGWSQGSKLYRRIGVPFLVCGASLLATHRWTILLCIPFLVWLAPSYGKDSWLFKLLKNDFLTRLVCFGWYWTAFALAYTLSI